ncbi:hypothetical protein CQW23_32889 [Capsicum baccatum]|uniref:Senescence-associated protein n=1 Tax=Capsicum baccatum TaxID=33114 RepID=A0A2G2V3E6_CAPBA|nr:hypothetical protein CQW23_32889 [Capsicum baccatum]
MVARRLGAMVPRRLGVTVAWRHGALVPRCPGAMAPRCQAALVPWCHGVGIQGERDRHLQGASYGADRSRSRPHTHCVYSPGACPESSIQYSPLVRRDGLVRSLAPAAPSWTTPPITDTSGKTNLPHDGLNPAHIPYWWVNNPTLGEFSFTMIGRADIKGSKSNVAMNAWLPQASYPCGNFFDTSTFEFRRSKGSLGHAFTMCRPSQTPHLTMSSARIGPQSEPWVQKEGQCPASDSRNNRIPLVRTSSELAVQRAGSISSSPPTAYVFGTGTPVPSPQSQCSSSPPTADGFGTGTPVPSPQSQSFSRSYGSILPTSLAYIVPSTRGCSPWRPNIVPSTRGCSPWIPDAVMSTTGHGRHSVLWIFKGRRERIGHHATCGALPAAGPYLRLSRFQGGQAVKQKR